MMKIAIVGATGPTGIHLVTELRKSVATVRVIARSIDKLARLFPEAAVEKLSADILDADATLRAVDGCDIVYDCIGLPGDQMPPMLAKGLVTGANLDGDAHSVRHIDVFPLNICPTEPVDGFAAASLSAFWSVLT